jgi:hypothetical protein
MNLQAGNLPVNELLLDGGVEFLGGGAEAGDQDDRVAVRGVVS